MSSKCAGANVTLEINHKYGRVEGKIVHVHGDVACVLITADGRGNEVSIQGQGCGGAFLVPYHSPITDTTYDYEMLVVTP